MAVAFPGRDYFRAGQLGDGSFGAVLVVYDEDGGEFAAKRFDEQDDGAYDATALREVGFLALIARAGASTPRLVAMHDVATVEDSLSMILPRLPCSLEGAIEGKALKGMQQLQVAQDLLAGLAWMHANGWMHRDVKAANVMLDADLRGVLIDFSLVKHESELAKEDAPKNKKARKQAKKAGVDAEERQNTAGVGTPTYTAPEVVEGEKYDCKADAWSAGVVCLEMFRGKVLEVEKDSHAFKLIAETTASMGDKPVPTMLKALLTVDQLQRATCAAALELPAFEKLAKVPAVTPFEWPAAPLPPNDQENAKPKAKGKVSEPWKIQVGRYARALELSPVSERGAVALEALLKDRAQGAMHAALLMCKLYDGEIDLEEAEEDWGPEFEGLNIPAYCETEKLAMRGMGFSLFAPPLDELKAKRRRVK